MKTDPPQPSRRLMQPPVQRKVFDVMRPGRAPASSTSKPVIVGHKPQVQDPSVTLNGVAERRPLLDSHHKIEIKPADGAPTAMPAPVVSSVPTAVPAAQPMFDASTAATTSSQTMPASSTSSTAPAGTAPHAITPEGSAAPTAEFEDVPDDMPAPEIDVEPQQITISPHVPNQGISPWKIIVPIVVVLLVALIIVDVLLDADFISWSVPHTHFF